MRKLAAKDLVKLRKQEFEEFCWQLLSKEYVGCFEPDTVDFLAGPSPEDVPDGGRDLEIKTLAPPTRRGHWSLLPREPRAVRFSCKSTKDERGRGWKAQVRDNIDEPRVIDGHERGLAEDASERAKKGPPPPRDLLEMLAEGGSYWVLINIEGDRVPEFEAEAAMRLSFWVDHELGQKVDLAGRIKVKDATFLAEVFNERPFALSPEQSRMLELDEDDFLHSWEQWSARLPERRLLRFEVDPERGRLIEELDGVLEGLISAEPAQRIFRLSGAPGVGKTRLVHHVLGRPVHAGLHDRVRYTKDAERARQWLERGEMARSPDVVLVIDEVPADAANELWRGFERGARSAARARLVMIGPRDDADEGKPEPSLLRPLDDERLEALVVHELEDTDSLAGVSRDDLIEVVTRLSEGYPLFAMWLTRALARDPGLLDDPHGELTDGVDPWLATAAVLAGPPSEFDQDRARWLAEAELRARALLLVVLVPDQPWQMSEERDQLLGVLEIDSWQELKRAAERCRNRGLLRDEPAGHYYISPANLERLVLNHLFREPWGLDPEPLRHRASSVFERLLRRAAHVEASQACRQRLTRGFLDRLDGMESERLPLLELVARLSPEATAFAVAHFVECRGAEAIAAEDGLVGPIRSSLEHLRHRRISRGAFAAVEHALFLLALEKLEPWGNNARSVWASLFGAVVHQTHQRFEDRLDLLRRRLASDVPGERQVALDGVVRLMTGESGGHHPGWDDVDGPWELPTSREIVKRQGVGWRLLAEMSDEPDPGVRSKARERIADHFCAGLSSSSIGGVLDELPDKTRRWSPIERNALREAVEWSLEQQRREESSPSEGQAEHLTDLRDALRPADLQERILAQVGRGRPGDLSLVGSARLKQERDDDRALAREVVERPEVLVDNLAWLTSEAAVRSRVFGHALGVVDEQRALLPLLETTRSEDPARSVLVSYLCGWSDRAGDQALDPWLSEHVVDPSMANVVARTIVAIGGSDTRARMLIGLTDAEELEEGTLIGLGFWSWHEGVDLGVLDELIASLTRSSKESCRIEALGLAARRLERSSGELELEFVSLAHELLRSTSSEGLSAVAERDWIAVARHLHDRADAGAMSVVLTIAVEQSGYLSHIRAVLAHWRRSDPSALWRVLTREFAGLGGESASIPGYFVSELNLLADVSPDEALRWIGDDDERAERVAMWSSLHEEDLEPVVRALLVRFGPDGDVAGLLHGAAMLSHGRGSIDDFYDKQLERAARWAQDPQPEIAAWAGRLRDDLAGRSNRRRQREYA